jgi:hypothetical protein
MHAQGCLRVFVCVGVYAHARSLGCWYVQLFKRSTRLVGCRIPDSVFLAPAFVLWDVAPNAKAAPQAP